MPGHSSDIILPYDPSRARQLMAEAGYADGRELPGGGIGSFFNSPSPPRKPVVDFHIEHWQRTLGVAMRYQVLEWVAYWQHLAFGSPHIMGLSGLGTYGDPDAFMRQSFRTVQKPSGGWSHPDYERLIAQASRSPNQDERIRFYRQADALLIWEAPLIPMSYHDAAFLTKPWVKRMPHSPVSAYYVLEKCCVGLLSPTGR